MASKKFKAEDLREMVYGDTESLVMVKGSKTIVDQGRWETAYECVFEEKATGKFYSTGYSKGSTEYQESRPYEGEDEVDCIEVELREVTEKKWMPVA